MLRAILFDCDGVIVDTEPLHLAAFQEALLQEAIQLRDRDYYEKYLGTDDRDCFRLVFESERRPLTPDHLDRLIERKARIYRELAPTRLTVYPGIVTFVHQAAEQFQLAVVSGALRAEVEMALEVAQIRNLFPVIVGQEDVSAGKPAPEGFLLAKAMLDPNLAPHECVVIEDSLQGVSAAKRAGMRCLALTTSYPREMLSDADWIVSSLIEISPNQLAGWMAD